MQPSLILFLYSLTIFGINSIAQAEARVAAWACFGPLFLVLIHILRFLLSESCQHVDIRQYAHIYRPLLGLIKYASTFSTSSQCVLNIGGEYNATLLSGFSGD